MATAVDTSENYEGQREQRNENHSADAVSSRTHEPAGDHVRQRSNKAIGVDDRTRSEKDSLKRGRSDDKAGQDAGVRLTDALGYSVNARQPWYGTAPIEGRFESNSMGRDVWGNEDPRRQQREEQRVSANDPLAAMKRGVKQLRKAESERKEWKAQRERDLNEVEELARKQHKRRRHRHRRNSDADSLEDFHLDDDRDRRESIRGNVDGEDKRRRGHHHRHRHRENTSSNRDRTRSRSPERRR